MRSAKKNEANTNFTSEDFLLLEGKCIECDEKIFEGVPKDDTRKPRIRCCYCLARWWSFECKIRFPGLLFGQMH